MSSKKEIRRSMLKKRSELSADEIKEMSSIICNKVREFVSTEKIALFYPIKNEVDLLELMDLDIAFPKVLEDMQFYSYEGTFVKGMYDIPEPTGDRVEVETVIVPGSVFDLNGYRIGYGGGYYDKYLKEKHLKIGVCFDFQVIEKLPVEAHDVQLDILITEKRVIKFKE